VSRCYCNNEWHELKTVQKIRKRQNIYWKLDFTVTNRKNSQKTAKFYKMPKCVFSWPAQLKNGQIFRNWPWNGQSGKPEETSSCRGGQCNALARLGRWRSKSRSEPDHLLSIYGNATTQNWQCKRSKWDRQTIAAGLLTAHHVIRQLQKETKARRLLEFPVDKI